MLFTLFKIIILTFSFSIFAKEKAFDTAECLKSQFEVSLKHKGSLFGLLPVKMSVKKNLCELEVNFKKYLPKKWVIDICREPVHLKLDSKGSLSVIKRGKGCENGNFEKEYCGEIDNLIEVVQDHGLIFAKGQREDLETDHGKMYCSFLLLKNYLQKGRVFSNYRDNKTIIEGSFSTKNEGNCDLPAKKPVKAEPKTEEKAPEAPISEDKQDDEESF